MFGYEWNQMSNYSRTLPKFVLSPYTYIEWQRHLVAQFGCYRHQSYIVYINNICDWTWEKPPSMHTNSIEQDNRSHTVCLTLHY